MLKRLASLSFRKKWLVLAVWLVAAVGLTFANSAPFVFGNDRGIRLIGFGLAAAVFIDATIVRMIVVPATMELLGNRNWWFPRWLDRVVPHAALA